MRQTTVRSPWRDKQGRSIGFILGLRVLLALVVVLVTWNPSGYSFIEWVLAQIGTEQIFDYGLIKLMLGAALALGWATLAFMTRKWFGKRAIVVGATLLVLLFGFLQWGMRWDLGPALYALLWVGLIVLGVVLGFGASGRSLKNLKRRLDRPRQA